MLKRDKASLVQVQIVELDLRLLLILSICANLYTVLDFGSWKRDLSVPAQVTEMGRFTSRFFELLSPSPLLPLQMQTGKCFSHSLWYLHTNFLPQTIHQDPPRSLLRRQYKHTKKRCIKTGARPQNPMREKRSRCARHA